MSYAFTKREPSSMDGGVIPCLCIREHPSTYYENIKLGSVYPAFYDVANDKWVVHFDDMGHGRRLCQEYMLAKESLNESPMFTFLSDCSSESAIESPWLLPIRSYEDWRIGELMVDCEANRDDASYVRNVMSRPLWKAHFSDSEFVYIEQGGKA